jgi:hypothetical protein
LESIYFLEDEDVDPDLEQFPHKQQLGSLADFPNLKELSSPLDALVDLDSPAVSLDEAISKLPPSLTYLSINKHWNERAGSWHDNAVYRLLGNIVNVNEQNLPALKDIRIEPDGFYKSEVMYFRSLIQKLEDVGVKVYMGDAPDPWEQDDYYGEDYGWQPDSEEVESDDDEHPDEEGVWPIGRPSSTYG